MTHPEQLCFIFCMQDNVPVCATCLVTTHKKHEVIELDEANMGTKKKVSTEVA